MSNNGINENDVARKLQQIIDNGKNAEKDLYEFTTWVAKKEELQKNLNSVKYSKVTSMDLRTEVGNLDFEVESELAKEVTSKITEILEKHIELADKKIEEYTKKIEGYQKL